MGATAQQQARQMPAQGSQVLQVMNHELIHKLQPFTDYIIQPNAIQLRKAIGQIEATIFSTLDYSYRKEILPVSQDHLGARIKITKVHDCSLRVTKVFPNSPCQRLGISAQQYIVGLAEAQFQDLGTFAQALHTIIAAKKQVITLGICDQHGSTRLVPVPVSMLQEWRTSSQGFLGCQLAQGWMHRFKGRPRRAPISNSSQTLRNQQDFDAKTKQSERQIAKCQQTQQANQSQQWQQVQRRIGVQAIGQSIEITFKGILRSDILEDASTICRCKIYNRHCQHCWVEKQGNYLFFNKKTNKIISIPSASLLRIDQ